MLAWSLPLLMLALVTLSGHAVSLGWNGENAWRFTLVAFIAGIFSAILARSRMMDGFAILVSMLVGLGTVWTITALLSGQLNGGILERLRAYPRPVIDALFLDEISGANRDLTADTLLSLTIWMSSWIAMWMLLRVGYVLFALLAPCVLIMANQHFANEDSGWAIIAMIGLSLLIIIGQRFALKRTSWNLRQIPVADSLLRRAFITALAIAVIVSSTIFASPAAWSETVLQPMIERTVERLESMRREAQYWFDDILGTDTAPPRAGSYTDFSDGFQIGGPLSLTDQPEVLVQVDAQSAPYLKARTYDNYTGRGWTSSSAGEFADESQSIRTSHELRYNPNWEVALSSEARNERQPISVRISPLTPDTDTVFTVDSFLSADMQTVVRMSWTSVTDMPMQVSISTLNQLPPDVQKLGSLLLQSELTGDSSAWGPGATSDEMQAAIDAEVDDLARRGIEVRWTATPDGIVDTMFITGRLPVFDDVEAVFRYQTSTLIDPDYRTTGLSSIASPDQLTAAGTEYPTWVTERYLQTGDTVTDRTVQLTQEIVGDETNPYLQAVLIEDWLRSNIVYDESVDAPPGDQDLVDYVLFDHRYGYCEHYAASMTVMLRSLGIPARVVVGYSPGEWDEVTSSFLYRQRNAHAWVEVHFPGYGWIPFEPTANRPLGEFDLEPAGNDLDETESPDEAIEPTEALIPTADLATPDLSQDNSEATPQPTSDDELAQPPVVLEPEQSGGPPRWLLASSGIVLVLTAIGGGAWLLWSWSLRGLSPAASLMRRLQRVGAWLGIKPKPTTTPREYARQFEHTASGISIPVKRITRAYEIETFGPRVARDQVVNDARKAWSEIKRKWFRLLRRK